MSLINSVVILRMFHVLHLHMHLADPFIQSEMQCNTRYTFLIRMCIPWVQTHDQLCCKRKALSYTGAQT